MATSLPVCTGLCINPRDGGSSTDSTAAAPGVACTNLPLLYLHPCAATGFVAGHCYAAGMPATRKTCTICGTEFWGRADGLYCTPKCRQQAVRNRRKAAQR